MISLVRGFKDTLPEETALWQHVEAVSRQVFHDFSYQEIRVPILERTELFTRSIGTTTDIVEKEMYTFSDKGGTSLTMRPEATASFVRAYIEHKMYAKDPARKLYTMGPMFRRERPQKGRYRQFNQIDAEIFGIPDPRSDAELILVLMTILNQLQLENIVLHLNSLGCEACRPAFKASLSTFLADRTEHLCPDCLRRRDKNPLRIFDCKVSSCNDVMEQAPSVLDHLCGGCRDHFSSVRRALKRFQISYETDHRLVRGLDYYTRTTFEVLTGALGAQNAVAGGGRYDGLVKALGGPDQPAVGFAIGTDRLIELLSANKDNLVKGLHLFVAALGQKAQEEAFHWLQALREKKIRSEMDFQDRSLKAQMRRANKMGARYALIVGNQELESGTAVLRNLNTKDQADIPLDDLVAQVIHHVRKDQ
jgi:histidyl-tRNA synthetase